ncbi:hypothetical protein C8R43DRAFT_1111785, partial [Mycena crocata]
MPATTPNTLVVFGKDTESFYVGHGRRHAFQGMPVSFTEETGESGALSITETAWISFGPSGEKHIARNDVRKETRFSINISEAVVNHLKTKGLERVPTHMNNLNILKKHVGDAKFDSIIKGLLFGHDKSHIFLTVGGFIADVNEETKNDPDHPLTKVLLEFDEGWCLQPGSMLCPYSDRYFFLKFKKPNDSVIQSRWSLPDLMAQKLSELKELANSPEDQQFFAQLRIIEMQRQQQETALTMQEINMQRSLAMQEMNIRNNMSTMISNQMIDAGHAILQAGSP